MTVVGVGSKPAMGRSSPEPKVHRQFIAPSLQFVLAVAVYGERLTTAHLIAFGAIWTALILYVSSIIRQRRLARDCPELGEA